MNNEGNRYPDGAPQPAPEPGAEIRLSPGYITSDGIEVSAGPAFWIDRVSRRVADGMSVLIIEAVDSIELLSRWRAPRQLQWTGKFTDGIGDEILRRAGLERFGGWSPIAFTLVHNFTIRAGESGLVAFKRLLETVNDRMRSKSYSVELFDPDPADAVNYSYSEGAASHPRVSLELSAERAGLGWARVFGSGIVSQAVDWYALIEGGETAVIVDDSLTVQADADARALNAIRRAEVERWRGELVVVMNAAQDPGDVISVSDAALGLSDAAFRVARLRGRFATGLGARRGGGTRGAAAYELAMTLEGV